MPARNARVIRTPTACGPVVAGMYVALTRPYRGTDPLIVPALSNASSLPLTIRANRPPSELLLGLVRWADQSKAKVYSTPCVRCSICVISTPACSPETKTLWPTLNDAAGPASSGPGPSMSTSSTAPGAPSPLAVFTTDQPASVPRSNPAFTNCWADATAAVPAQDAMIQVRLMRMVVPPANSAAVGRTDPPPLSDGRPDPGPQPAAGPAASPPILTPMSSAAPPAAAPVHTGWLERTRIVAADIKLAHSAFAMPFAVLGAFLAHPRDGSVGVFIGQLALVVACMVAARTWAMLFNRLADRRIDAANPRTARRALASGRLTPAQGWAAAGVAAAAFVAC